MEEAVYSNRMLILFNIVMMTFMATLDGSIVNVALPVMASELSVTTQSIAWVVTVYLVVISTTILIFGKLGDIHGKTRIFKFGIVVFTLGSLMCGIPISFPFLMAARIIQAVGAAGFMANSQGIITHVFPRNERGRALGISGTFVALGSLVGPPLGGFIVSILNWNYIFLINVPIGIFTFLMGMKTLPKDDYKSSEKFDLKGAVLIIITIFAIFGSLSAGETYGYARPFILAGFAIAAVILFIFMALEKKVASPLLDLNIFHNKLFSLSIFCGFLSFVAISCSTIIQPFYLQNVMKLSPATTGLIMMAFPLIMAVVAPVSGHMSDKIGSEFLTFLGLLFTSAGLFLLSTLNEYSSMTLLVAFIAVMSVGNGMFQSPNTSLIMSTVSIDKLGIAGSINALVRNLGMVFGISMSTALLYDRMSFKLGHRVSDFIPGEEHAFIYGMRIVYILAGCFCAFGALLTAYRLIEKRMKLKS